MNIFSFGLPGEEYVGRIEINEHIIRLRHKVCNELDEMGVPTGKKAINSMGDKIYIPQKAIDDGSVVVYKELETDETGEEFDRLQVYRAAHSEITPIFNKTKIWDDQTSEPDTVVLPADIDGTIVSYTETASANSNRPG